MLPVAMSSPLRIRWWRRVVVVARAELDPVEERRPEVAHVGVLRVALEVELAAGLEARDVALGVARDLVGAGVDRVLLAVARRDCSRSKRRANSFGTGTEIGIASAPASAAPVPFVSLNTSVWSSGVRMPLTGR